MNDILIQTPRKMAVTKVERKKRVLRNRTKKRNASIKRLTTQPVIRKVDIEELKKSFAENTSEN